MFSSGVGLLLVVLVMLDMFWTTLTTRGSGYFTRWIALGVRWFLALLYRLSGSRRPLLVSGPVALVFLGTFWLLALWLGWFLIFNGLFDPVVYAQTGRPASDFELLYYVGFTLSTLGVGDFRPQGGTAQVLTGVAAFNGLVLVTLVITYALPVVSAAITRRQVAFSIALLGNSPLTILKNTWSGVDFRSLESTLDGLEASLIQCTEQRLAYPVVDYFFTRKADFSLSLQLAILDEALTLATVGLEDSCQPDHFVIRRTRQIISYYLEYSAPELPSKPEADPPYSRAAMESWVMGAGERLELRRQDDFESRLTSLAERRRDLHRLVRSDGWRWEDVYKLDEALKS